MAALVLPLLTSLQMALHITEQVAAAAEVGWVGQV
jgi:hypothetical protein